MENQTKIKVAILSLGLSTILFNGAIAPVLGSMGEDILISDTQVRLILPISSLGLIVGIFLANFLANRVNIRKLIIIGSFMFTIFGIAPVFSTNYNVIITTRVIAGIALGVMLPFSLSLIPILVKPDDRIKMTGFVATANNLGGIFSITLAGIFLTMFNWQISFLVFLIGLIPLVMSMMYLPKDITWPETKKEKVDFNFNVIIVLVFMMLAMSIFYIFLVDLSGYVIKDNLGTSQLVVIINIMLPLIAMIFSSYFNKIYTKLDIKIFYLTLPTLSLGMLIASNSERIFVIIGSLIVAVGLIFIPFSFSMISKVVSKQNDIAPLSNYMNIAMVSGQIISPFLITSISLGNAQSGSERFFTASIFGFVLSAIYIYLLFFKKINTN